MQLFGSGYAWLTVDTSAPQGTLRVITTTNQNTPAPPLLPILVLDVVWPQPASLCVSPGVYPCPCAFLRFQWEHAYYLKFQNKRADFVSGWWDIVNWDKVRVLFSHFTASACHPVLCFFRVQAEERFGNVKLAIA